MAVLVIGNVGAVEPVEMPSIQIKFGTDGAPWHRLMITAVRDFHHGLRSNVRTACGKSVSGYYAPREETYEGRLCLDGCFTAHELLEARSLRERIQRDAEDVAPVETDLDRDEVRRRLSTGRFPKLAVDDDDDIKEED